MTELGAPLFCGDHLHDLEIGVLFVYITHEILISLILSFFEGMFILIFSYPLHASPRLDLGYYVVHTVGNFLFSMLRTLQWYQSRIYA